MRHRFEHFEEHAAEKELREVASAAAPGAADVVKDARAAGIGWPTILQYIFSPNGVQLLITLVQALLKQPPTPPAAPAS